MKKLIGFLFLVSFVVVAQDNTLTVYNDTFTPSTLFAGTSMASRTLSTSFDDTTRAFNTRGYAAVYVGIEAAGNDSGRVLFSYSPSKDGVNFETFVAMDSASFVDAGYVKYIPLPSNALGAYAVRIRAYGDANVARYSANPSTTAAFKIIRVPYNDVKLR